MTSVLRRALVAACTVAVGAVFVGAQLSSASDHHNAPAAHPSTSLPRVLRIHPDTVVGKGGTTIVIRGTGFTAGAEVLIGGRHATSVTVRNADGIVATAPRGFGTLEVRVVTSAGTSKTNVRSVLHYQSTVLVVGDSLGIDLGWGFTPTLDAQNRLAMVDDAVGSTGLVRSDYYNWPVHLKQDIAATRCDVVEALFGTNDQQALVNSKGQDVEPGTSAWDHIYASRVRQIASIVRDAGATLVWVGLPRMGPNSVLNQKLVSDLVALDRSVVDTLPQAVFVNTFPVFTNAKGAYTPYVEVSPGVWELGHAPDGTHLTTAGATVIDARAIAALSRLLTGR